MSSNSTLAPAIDWQDVPSPQPSNDWSDVSPQPTSQGNLPSATAPFPGETDDQGLVGNVVTGFEKGANDLAVGAKNIANKALPSSLQIPRLPVEGTDMETHGMAQGAGYGLESAAEALLGSEEMKALSVGERLEKVAPIMRLIESNPTLARIVSSGLKFGTIGAAQGGAHGAATGQGEEGAAIGGASGLMLGAAGEGVYVLHDNGGQILAGLIRDPETNEITVTPTKVLNRIVPEHPEYAEKRTAAELESKMKETETARQKELTDNEKLKLQDAESRQRRGVQQQAIDKKNAVKEPKIVKPSDAAERRVGTEGRPASWTTERVLQLSKQGNREAIGQAIRRGLELPENARYVMGDADFEGGSYNPRNVTTFTPEGTPVRQGGKVSQ